MIDRPGFGLDAPPQRRVGYIAAPGSDFAREIEARESGAIAVDQEEP
jgi:hypothetical protein